MMPTNPALLDLPYNFIVVLKPSRKKVIVHFSTDNSPWEKSPMIQIGVRYYGSLTRRFRMIKYYFTGRSKRGKKLSWGSKQEPFSGMHVSLMGMQPLNLLEIIPKDCIRELNIFDSQVIY